MPDLTLAIVKAMLMETRGTRLTLSMRNGHFVARLEVGGRPRTAISASLENAIHEVLAQPALPKVREL